ncbi:MAG: peptidoglycan-binding protein [Nodosilinea sp.]
MALVQEYCQLALRPSLSEAEGNRMAELLALAEHNGQLDFWINEADHFIDHALGFGSASRVYASVNENLKARLRELLDLTNNAEAKANEESLALLEELNDSLAAGTREVQQRLAQRGYDPGPVDGVAGPKTRQALKAFEHQEHQELAQMPQYNETQTQPY